MKTPRIVPTAVFFPATWFKVRPIHRSPKYFVVHLAETVKEMRAEMRRGAGGCHPRQLGAVLAVTSDTDRHVLGIIYLAKNCLGAGIVSHEMTHAAFRTFERIGVALEPTKVVQRKWSSTHHSEEQFCRMVERLNMQFWLEFYRQKKLTSRRSSGRLSRGR